MKKPPRSQDRPRRAHNARSLDPAQLDTVVAASCGGKHLPEVTLG